MAFEPTCFCSTSGLCFLVNDKTLDANDLSCFVIFALDVEMSLADELRPCVFLFVVGVAIWDFLLCCSEVGVDTDFFLIFC